MPVPATTGALKTRVSDMEIGDYIPCEYAAGQTGAVGTVRNLANSTLAPEIPLTGSSTPNGTFYFIKVAKGLLLSDRIVRHTVSWDFLNTNKYIQGYPWDAGNIIPIMTNYTSPTGVVSASSELSGKEAWKAFANGTSTNNTFWRSTGATNEWLAYEFPENRTVSAYSLQKNDYISSVITGWKLQGWNGTEWVVLHEVSGETTWTNGVKKLYKIKPSNYKKFRILFTEIVSGATYVTVGAFNLYETTGTIRSLTGGVAYRADEADNGYSTTDKGLSATPADNEWDSLIVNFPQELIQPGKTLDDVFHWNGVFTWCQETPMNGISTVNGSAVNTWRVYRGNKSAEQLQMYLSNYTHSTLGFRPVFQYHEEV